MSHPAEQHDKESVQKTNTATAAAKQQLVTVTVTITDADGNTTTEEKSIPGGPTEVPTLKQELGVAAEDSLWFVKHGKKKLLADHEKHDVKQDDHFEVVSKGGVS